MRPLLLLSVLLAPTFAFANDPYLPLSDTSKNTFEDASGNTTFNANPNQNQSMRIPSTGSPNDAVNSAGDHSLTTNESGQLTPVVEGNPETFEVIGSSECANGDSECFFDDISDNAAQEDWDSPAKKAEQLYNKGTTFDAQNKMQQ